MKKVIGLTQQQLIELEELYKNGKTSRVRRRSHLILLSHKGKSIKELCDIFELNRDTVSDTITNYNKLGINGLYDKARSGRPPALTEEEEEFVLEEVARDSRNLKRILHLLKEKFNKTICKATLIRFLKKKVYMETIS